MRIVMRVVSVVLLTICCWLVSVAINVTPASACDPGEVPSPLDGSICIPVHDPGEDGDEDPGTETTGTAMCTYQGQKIPCVTEDGVWFASHQCYAQPADPQTLDESPLVGR